MSVLNQTRTILSPSAMAMAPQYSGTFLGRSPKKRPIVTKQYQPPAGTLTFMGRRPSCRI